MTREPHKEIELELTMPSIDWPFIYVRKNPPSEEEAAAKMEDGGVVDTHMALRARTGSPTETLVKLFGRD